MNNNTEVAVDAYLEDPEAFNAALDERTKEGGIGRCGRKKIGENVLIRSATYHYIGRLAYVDGLTVGLDDACWYNTTGDWHEALSTGQVSSLEKYPDGSKTPDILIQSIVEMCPWPAKLPG